MSAPTRTRTLRFLLGTSPWRRRRRATPRPTRRWRDDSGMSTVEYAIGTVAAAAFAAILYTVLSDYDCRLSRCRLLPPLAA